MGIPWRHIPVYDAAGTIQRTGDSYGVPEVLQKDEMVTYRRKGQFSPVHSSSEGTRELLETVRESRTNSGEIIADPPGFPRASPPSAREAWMELVRRRSSGRTSLNGHSSPSIGHQSTNGDDRSSLASGFATDRHWAFKKQKGGAVEVAATKEHCPYHREDSIPESRAVQTPTKRTSLASRSPRPSLGGDPEVDMHAFAAEKVTEARRDWQYLQDKPSAESEHLRSPNRSSFGNSPDKSPYTNRSVASATSSRSGAGRSQASSAMDHPVHSLRARPPSEMARRPRWRG